MATRYLPSKKFTRIFLIGIGLFAVIFFVSKYYTQISAKFTRSGSSAGLETATLGSLIEKDSNKNGIADWEEALWGLDPAGDGPKNKAIVAANKKKLEQNENAGQGSNSDSEINETQALSREFFTAVASLKTSDGLTAENINTLANQISTKVAANKNIPDAHTIAEVEIAPSTATAIKKYYDELTQATRDQEDKRLGDELVIVDNALAGKDSTFLYAELTVIAKGYTEYGEALFAIHPPKEIAQTHLAFVNANLAMATVVANMSQVISNPLVGMIGIAQYKPYSDALDTLSDTTRDYFVANGIIKKQ
jgi:hypothetical protein